MIEPGRITVIRSSARTRQLRWTMPCVPSDGSWHMQDRRIRRSKFGPDWPRRARTAAEDGPPMPHSAEMMKYAPSDEVTEHPGQDHGSVRSVAVLAASRLDAAGWPD